MEDYLRVKDLTFRNSADADADADAGFWSIDVMEHYQWPEERLSPDTKCTYCNLRIIIIFDEAEEHDDDTIILSIRPIYIWEKIKRKRTKIGANYAQQVEPDS